MKDDANYFQNTVWKKKKVLMRALKKKAEDTDLHGANYQK
jgi:hypothetical protein